VFLIGAGVFAVNEVRSESAGNNISKVHSCSHKGQIYTATIQNDQVKPSHINAKLCDTLTVKNLDTTMRKIGFGVHEHHSAYDGVLEKTIGFKDSFTVTLNQTGNYLYHDHYHDEVQGTFTVK
jgi:hypothetical protein